MTTNRIDLLIVTSLITELVDEHHLTIGIDATLRRTDRVDLIQAELFQSDEEYLKVYDPTGKTIGTILLVHGNEPGVVIADNSVSLEPFMTKTAALVKFLEGQEG